MTAAVALCRKKGTNVVSRKKKMGARIRLVEHCISTTVLFILFYPLRRQCLSIMIYCYIFWYLEKRGRTLDIRYRDAFALSTAHPTLHWSHWLRTLHTHTLSHLFLASCSSSAQIVTNLSIHPIALSLVNIYVVEVSSISLCVFTLLAPSSSSSIYITSFSSKSLSVSHCCVWTSALKDLIDWKDDRSHRLQSTPLIHPDLFNLLPVSLHSHIRHVDGHCPVWAVRNIKERERETYTIHITNAECRITNEHSPSPPLSLSLSLSLSLFYVFFSLRLTLILLFPIAGFDLDHGCRASGHVTHTHTRLLPAPHCKRHKYIQAKGKSLFIFSLYVCAECVYWTWIRVIAYVYRRCRL